MAYNEIIGDLIKLAQKGEFEVITHGCNSMSIMSAGIAPQMARAFGCDRYPLEDVMTRGDINKLGQIEFQTKYVAIGKELIVVNSYTQFSPNIASKPLDYDALTMCMRKINHRFRGMKIGLPKIGAGLAGGDWNRIKEIIQRELVDCDVTVVMLH